MVEVSADLVSVYTPTYNSGVLLHDVYASLKQQTYSNWEWVICDDGSDCETRQILYDLQKLDARIKISYFTHSGYIGLMKKLCTERASGAILIELDHDDQLTEDCVSEVVNAFALDNTLGMVYSNFAEVGPSGLCHEYQARYWKYRDTKYNNKVYKEAIAQDVYGKIKEFPDPVIQHWSLAPNHVRAFRKSELIRVGGYDKDLKYGDDFDLTIRMFMRSRIKHISKLLYLYRYDKNTWKVSNRELQAIMCKVRDKYFPRVRLDVGCGPNKQIGYIGVDSFKYDGVDHVCDFANEGLFMFRDSSVDEIRAVDFIEHIADKVVTLEEFYRVLKNGALLYIQVPSTDGRGAFQDPTHKSFWNENSFHDMYMSGCFRYNARYKFSVEALITTRKDSMGVCWVQTWLKVIK